MISGAIMCSEVCELGTAFLFAIATRFVRPQDMHNSALISADLDQHVAWLVQYIKLGFEELHLHQVGRN